MKITNRVKPVFNRAKALKKYENAFILVTQEELDSITASTQSTEECLNCPIARGCAWCSGYNYQETGDVNKRVTYICVMHKARALANTYYWNKFYQKRNIKSYYENFVPDEWALQIIPADELNLIKDLV